MAKALQETFPYAPAWLLAISLLSLACDPVDACDPDQYFNGGACVACPQDAVSTGETCVCNDPAASFEGGRCRGPKAPAADAAVDEDAGQEGTHGAACDTYCDFLGACLAENPVVQGVAADVLEAAGLQGSSTSECVQTCLLGAGSSDQQALECFGSASAVAACAGDTTLAGVEEALGIVDGCCQEHAQSQICTELCTDIAINPVALGMVPACQ